MRKNYRYPLLAAVLLASVAVAAFAPAAAPTAAEAELLAVLRSDAPLQQKSYASQQLARIATKASVPGLAALLGDEKLSHMARYALETIPDPSVDEALREALGKVQGRPLLGVIGSIGARRDAKAVEALAQLLKRPATAAAAARALGNIGTAAAAKALEAALPGTTGAVQLSVCEGLLRCAEALAKDGQVAPALAIYDHLRNFAAAPQQVRAAGLRGAILSRGKEGVPLLVAAFRGGDYAQAAMAARAALELPGSEVADALLAELPQASPDRQSLLIVVLADRHDHRILPTVLKAAQDANSPLRILAFRALKQVGDGSCVPALLTAAVSADSELVKAAVETLACIQDKSVDAQLTAKLADAKGKMRLLLIQVVGQRRTAAAAPALWKAAADADPAVRAAALASLGGIAEAADLPKLIARIGDVKDKQEAEAMDRALREICLRSKDREAAAAQIVASLPTAAKSAQGRILDLLNYCGGATALQAAVAAARSSDVGLRDEAFRVLGRWRQVEAAPVLLELHNSLTDARLKTRAIRAYIRIARQFDMPADRRAAMCRTALKTAARDEDKRLILEILLRYPDDEMAEIAEQATTIPGLKDEASVVLLGMSSKGVNRAELGRVLAQAGHAPVKLEISKAAYGAGEKTKDVTDVLRKCAKNFRVIFLPSVSYNESFGGDPAPGVVKRLTISYRINGKAGEVALTENATIVLPVPK